MATCYITIKLTLTQVSTEQDGKPRFRSRIDRSPLGASKGSGVDFDFTQEEEQKIEAFKKLISNGQISRKEIKDIGQMLFKKIFQEDVLTRFNECIAYASNRASLRLALAIVSEHLLDKPWEYLHNNTSFLLHKQISIIRVIDELQEKEFANLPIQNLLVAIANPKDCDQFDVTQHKKNLEKILENINSLNVTYLITTKEEDLQKELENKNYDAFYFIGHGKFTSFMEGKLIVEDETGNSKCLDARILANWLRKNPGEKNTWFVYLNSCSTAQTNETEPFAGVAQRLILDGGITTVIAMQTEIPQDSAIRMARAFFERLQKGMGLEDSLIHARETCMNDIYSWGIPVLYTHSPIYTDPSSLQSNLPKIEKFSFFWDGNEEPIPVNLDEAVVVATDNGIIESAVIPYPNDPYTVLIIFPPSISEVEVRVKPLPLSPDIIYIGNLSYVGYKEKQSSIILKKENDHKILKRRNG